MLLACGAGVSKKPGAQAEINVLSLQSRRKHKAWGASRNNALSMRSRRKHKAWGQAEINALSLRSRRKHKAWGASPRLVIRKCIQPAIAGDSGCRPFHGLMDLL